MPVPYQRHARRTGKANDYTRFNPAYFQLLEKRLLQLQAAGIEADCILFHPYDAWGYKAMPNEVDDFYLRYAIARLSAFRNVWWSIANEYDLVKRQDHVRLGPLLPHRAGRRSLQPPPLHPSLAASSTTTPNPGAHTPACRATTSKSPPNAALAWNKPIIYDEIQYEGDVERRWGNLSAEEMTRRFWLATIYGSYATHGEVFISADSGPHAHESSWSDAGRLRGDSAPRIKFLHDLVAKITNVGLNEFEGSYYLSAGTPNQLYLWYFDYHRPARYEFPLPNTANFAATLIDPFDDDREEAARHILRQVAHRSSQQARIRRSSSARSPTSSASPPAKLQHLKSLTELPSDLTMNRDLVIDNAHHLLLSLIASSPLHSPHSQRRAVRSLIARHAARAIRRRRICAPPSRSSAATRRILLAGRARSAPRSYDKDDP